MILADLGADVVKVERPGSGDPGRASFEDYGFEESDYFLNWNSNKKSVTIALDQPEGRALLLRLVERFDVFVENFGPGVLEKLDLDYDAVRRVNPGIIYGRIKGFGSSGPCGRSSWSTPASGRWRSCSPRRSAGTSSGCCS